MVVEECVNLLLGMAEVRAWWEPAMRKQPDTELGGVSWVYRYGRFYFSGLFVS